MNEEIIKIIGTVIGTGAVVKVLDWLQARSKFKDENENRRFLDNESVRQEYIVEMRKELERRQALIERLASDKDMLREENTKLRLELGRVDRRHNKQ